jgi:hypothetical protein
LGAINGKRCLLRLFSPRLLVHDDRPFDKGPFKHNKRDLAMFNLVTDSKLRAAISSDFGSMTSPSADSLPPLDRITASRQVGVSKLLLCMTGISARVLGSMEIRIHAPNGRRAKLL